VKFQFRRWVEAQIEAADGAPAAHVTVLGGLAEFERQPIRERASALWRTV
jgi:DNA invertase Pin-like site-specific DNA recombinase